MNDEDLNYVIDDDGKWQINSNGTMDLIEPSKEWLDSAIKKVSVEPPPSQEEMDKANRQIEILNTLMEVGLL